jgi:hypothetical protein
MVENKKNQNNAPVTACIFSQSTGADVKLADGTAAVGKKDHFKIVGYSGQIIPKHWFWGNLAFDLTGLSFAKAMTPVLQEHLTSKRIGVSRTQKITDKVIFEGTFLDNPNAQEIKEDMLAGFPMEASLYVPPLVVEYVKEGTSVTVNGQTLAGPGSVFREAVIKEVSICVFGADSNTSAAALTEKNNSEVKFDIFKAEPNQAATEIKVTPVAHEPKRQVKHLSDKEFWAKLYDVSPEIQSEFSSADIYVAYKVAEAAGLIGIIQHRTVKI